MAHFYSPEQMCKTEYVLRFTTMKTAYTLDLFAQMIKGVFKPKNHLGNNSELTSSNLNEENKLEQIKTSRRTSGPDFGAWLIDNMFIKPNSDTEN